MKANGIHRTSGAVAIVSAGCIALGVVACGSEPVDVSLAPMGTGPAVLAVPADVAPTHDGTLVMAGAYPVEVVPHASGQVYAYVRGDATPPPTSTELAVVVPVSGGVRTVELEWDPGEARWAGQLRRVEIVPGPVDVVLVVGDSRWVGHSTTFVVRPAVVLVAAPVVVAPVVVAPAPVIVVPVYEEHHDHGRHLGWDHHGPGHGHGHGHFPH